MKTPCGECNRGLTEKKELCDKCEGTMFLKEVEEAPKKESVVSKVKRVLKKK